MRRTTILLGSLLAVGLSAISLNSFAHTPFIAPQTYVVDGESTTVIGGYAEVPFASEFALNNFEFSLTTPDGAVHSLAPQATKYLTIADIDSKAEGSYKVQATRQSSVDYAQIKGKWYRVMQAHTNELPPLSERSFAQPSEVPAKAKKISTTSHTQLLSYFSRGKTTDEVLKPTGQGLEVRWSSHPNHLVAGQPLSLTLTENGKALPAYEVVAIKRTQAVGEQLTEIAGKTDAQGQIQLSLPAAGEYLLQLSSPTNPKQQPSAQSYRLNIAVSVH